MAGKEGSWRSGLGPGGVGSEDVFWGWRRWIEEEGRERENDGHGSKSVLRRNLTGLSCY